MGKSGLELLQYTEWLDEIQQQPAWRSRADREMDYYAGNQLSADVLARQAEVGIPPAIEPLIGPTIDAVLGAEVKNRLDWRVKAEDGGDDIALALNVKLNKAEKKSGADAACSAAYASQVSVGLGWVEVGRNMDPFKFPYRCRQIHRNEIWWDWLAKEPDLSDARYIIRRKWMNRDTVELMFPAQKDLIRGAGTGWMGIDIGNFSTDGGGITDLAMSIEEERGWSIEEMEWRDLSAKRVCLFEVWYQVWEKALIIKTKDGRIVEFDKKNLLHMSLVAEGIIKPRYAVVSRMRLAWWVGPHCLHDGPTPYKHNRFPYVPFWGKREDRTGKPYGLIRGMMYLQDEVNARISKMQWLLSAKRTIRTAGAVMMSDTEFNAEIGRPDADIVLDPVKMRDNGVFKVESDFQLNAQQSARLEDARNGIKRTGGVANAFMGVDGPVKSGVAIDSLVQQSNQTLADINDNFGYGRALVGDILMSLIIEDMGNEQQDVEIPATVNKEKRVVSLNVPAEKDGIQVLDNDIQRVKIKVELSDVPSSPTFRTQQLQTMGGAFESLAEKYQAVALPHLLNLMDVPYKEEILEEIKKLSAQPTPEDIDKMITDAVQKDRLMRMTAQKDREIAIKEKIGDKEALKKAIETIYAAMQTGSILAENPHIAPVGDDLLDMAGAGSMATPSPMEQPEAPMMAPQSPNIGANAGMTTPDLGDNLGGAV